MTRRRSARALLRPVRPQTTARGHRCERLQTDSSPTGAKKIVGAGKLLWRARYPIKGARQARNRGRNRLGAPGRRAADTRASNSAATVAVGEWARHTRHRRPAFASSLLRMRHLGRHPTPMDSLGVPDHRDAFLVGAARSLGHPRRRPNPRVHRCGPAASNGRAPPRTPERSLAVGLRPSRARRWRA